MECSRSKMEFGSFSCSQFMCSVSCNVRIHAKQQQQQHRTHSHKFSRFYRIHFQKHPHKTSVNKTESHLQWMVPICFGPKSIAALVIKRAPKLNPNRNDEFESNDKSLNATNLSVKIFAIDL